jgi:hypothetical protein
MSTLDQTKKSNATESELETYLENIKPRLDSEHSKFLHGDGVYVGANVLREFYKGDQWQFKKSGGGAMRVYNYCFSVVENMTAFLSNQPPEMNSVPRDQSNKIERARSEAINKLLGKVHHANRMPIQYQKSVRVGSITGRSCIFGPIWDEKNDTIRYWNIERPEAIRPIWKDDNYNDLTGFTNEYMMDLYAFKKAFRSELEENDIDPDAIHSLNDTAKSDMKSYIEPSWAKGAGIDIDNTEQVYVKEYFDDKYSMTQVKMGGGEWKMIDFFVHDYGFVPLVFIPNIHNPGSQDGTSDIENILDAQIAYNEAKSNEEDIVRQVAYSALWGKNLENYSVIETGAGMIYSFNDEADIQAMPRSENPTVLTNFQKMVQSDMVNLSGQNQALYPAGAKSVLGSTGRALSVVMQGINNKVSLRKNFWEYAFEELNRNILLLTSEKIKNGDKLVGGNYDTNVFISSVLLRDVTEEINKFNHKLQSLTSTQKNLGISSPLEEQKLMKEELKDPLLSAEIARQPGLVQQIIQDSLAQGKAQQQASNAPPGVMNQGEGEASGEQPAATPQQRGPSGQSPEGAVRGAGQQATGVSQAREGEPGNA